MRVELEVRVSVAKECASVSEIEIASAEADAIAKRPYKVAASK